MTVSPSLGRLSLPALVVLLSACSSGPPEKIEALEQARASYERVSENPVVARHAPNELDAARASLNSATALWEEEQSKTEINHLAYLASQRVMIAELIAQSKEAEVELALIDRESQRMALDIRDESIEQRRREELAERQQMQNMQARETERGMVLTLGDVLFDVGQASLKPGAQRNLQRISEFMRHHPERTAVIEGHTDSMGNDEYNLSLSRERAFAVHSALVKLGVEAGRLTTRGFGEALPVAGNDSPYGRQENRRVEIIFPTPRTTVSEYVE